MIIVTDSREYSDHILNIDTEWSDFNSKHLQELPLKLTEKLFHSPALSYTKTEHKTLWNYAFIAEHAWQSQFSVLMEVLKNNPDFKDGILCLAGSGKNFKGYRNRKWQSLPGNIHLSMFLNPDRPVTNFHTGFTILCAVSVVNSIDAIDGLEGKSSIKWVNDIIINKAKIAGVLTQTQTQGEKVSGVFLGIGVNIQTTPILKSNLFVPQATSLKDHAPCSEAAVLANLLKNISENYTILIDGGYNSILNQYRQRSYIIGRHVTVYSDPLDSEPQITARGKVIEIGENLELYLEDLQEPIIRGRIKL